VYQIEPETLESGLEINVKNASDMMSFTTLRLERLYALASSKNRMKLDEVQIINENITRIKKPIKNPDFFIPP